MATLGSSAAGGVGGANLRVVLAPTVSVTSFVLCCDNLSTCALVRVCVCVDRCVCVYLWCLAALMSDTFASRPPVRFFT